MRPLVLLPLAMIVAGCSAASSLPPKGGSGPAGRLVPPDEGLVIQGERLEDRVARERAERRAAEARRRTALPSAP